jgi:hypothetical protein
VRVRFLRTAGWDVAIRNHSAMAIGAAGPNHPRTRIHLESPAVVTRGDRFILRAYSPLATIGGGVVLDPRPARGSIRSAAGIERFRRLDAPGADRDRALVAFVNESEGAGFPRRALVSRAGLSYAEADQRSIVTAQRKASGRGVIAR